MNQLLVAATSVLEGFDWIVLAIYFLALVAVAVWVVIQKLSLIHISEPTRPY